MRTRTKSEVPVLTNWSGTYREYGGTCSVPQAYIEKYTSGSYYPRVYTDVMHDIVTPDWSSKRAHGIIVNNPMDRSTFLKLEGETYFYYDRTYDVPTLCSGVMTNLRRGQIHSYARGSGAFFASNEAAYAPTPSLYLDGEIDRAVTKAYANIELSKAMALATLGEGKETIVSLVSIFQRLIKIIKAFKGLVRGDLRSAAYLKKQISPKELADRYMEVRYALRPLVYDAKSILSAFTVDMAKNRFTFRGYSVASDKNETSTDYWFEPEFGCRFKAITTRNVNVRAGVLTQCEQATKFNTWGFDSVLESVWELIPLSFIMDWFFNIGDLIASWTPEMGVKELASWYVIEDTTYRYRWISDFFTHDISGRQYVDHHWSADNAYTSEFSVVKERVPSPSKSILPSFKVNLDVLKLLDLAIIAKKMWRV